MAGLQGAVAERQTLVENLPELVEVAAGAEGHIHQIDGHNALIEAAVILGLAGLGVHIRGEEAAAAHAGVAVALAVLVYLQLEHLLLGDIVGHHPLGGALGSQLSQIVVGVAGVDVVLLQHIDELGEGGGDPDTGLILHALIALADGLLDDDGKVGLLLRVAGLTQIHKDGDEGSLTVGGHKGDDLILDGLDAAVDLIAQAALHDLALALGRNIQTLHLSLDLSGDLLAGDVHEGGKVGQADALAAVLVGGHLRDDLGGDVAGGGETVGLLDIGARDDRAVLEHIVQIDEVAVVHMLGKVVGVVEVDETLLMSLDDLGVQQQAGGQILGDLTGHVVALDAVDGGVLVGVLLLDFLVLALDKAQDTLVGGVGLALEALDIAVGDIVAGDVMGLDVHELVLHHILYLFHADGAVECLTLIGHGCGDVSDLLPGETGLAAHRIAGFGDSGDDLGNIERYFSTVAFDDLHSAPPVSHIQCERVSPCARGTRKSRDSLILSYHYLVICQWKNHYILCFVAFAKNNGEFPEQNLRRNLLTICAREAGAFLGVIKAVVYTLPFI